MPLNTTGRTGPLEGTVVVDLTRALAGPHAAMMLGDLGADVVKVETPKGGDDTRVWGPPFISAPDAERESTYFLSANRNKRSIAIDLKTDDGREALEEIVKRSDVLLENFRTGVLDRLGFSPERLAELNPRLVVLSISGFGHDGPEGGRAGYDQIAQGEAGLMSFTGSGPNDVQRVGVPIADLLRVCTARSGCWLLCANGTGPVAAKSCVLRCWPVWWECMPSRARNGLSQERWAKPREPQSVHLPLRAVFHRRRSRSDLRRQ